MDVADQEVLRLILKGGSVIDWRRLHFRDAAEVDRFLHLHLFDLEDPRDEARLRAVLAQAVEYLRTAYGYRVAAAVAAPEDLRTLFLLASGVAEPSRYRRIACVVLKVMHVVHHVEARELLFRTPMRESDLADRVERRVMAVARRMAEAGLPVVEFQGNRKSRDSLVTKLLVKKESVAAQVFDRVRYRILTRSAADVAPVLRHLWQELFPFNYVVPGQSENSLVPFREGESGTVAGGTTRSARPPTGPSTSWWTSRCASTTSCRPAPPPAGEDLGRIVFAMVEFQVMDEETSRRNEQGAANHRRYKKRQAVSALRRLSRGLVVPRKRKARAWRSYFLWRAFLRACRSRLRFLLRASRSAALSVEMGSGA